MELSEFRKQSRKEIADRMKKYLEFEQEEVKGQLKEGQKTSNEIFTIAAEKGAAVVDFCRSLGVSLPCCSISYSKYIENLKEIIKTP